MGASAGYCYCLLYHFLMWSLCYTNFFNALIKLTPFFLAAVPSPPPSPPSPPVSNPATLLDPGLTRDLQFIFQMDFIQLLDSAVMLVFRSDMEQALAASLGLRPSQVQTISVQSGSVVLDVLWPVMPRRSLPLTWHWER